MKRFFYIGLFSCLLVACNPDKDIFTPNPIFSEGFVTTSISGQILDVTSQPVEGAIITLDQLDRTSDVNGFFYFKNVQVDAKRAILNVNKDGFFAGGRAVFPTKESNAPLKIRLLEKAVVANFDGSAGGEVDLPDGVILDVPTDAVLSQNGTGFSEEVQVSAYSLNPESLEGLQKMPIDLKGETTSDEEKILESFGIFLFDWSDANNQKLSIVPGKKVTIQFPISNGVGAQAPSTLGLWYFDNADNIWKEEGTVTLQNGNYVAEVGKTGFWNIATPHDFISVKGVLENQNAGVLSNMPFSIEIDNGGILGFGYADEDGKFNVNVPKNLASKIKVLDECNDIDYSTTIGALDIDFQISSVKINNSSDFSHISGTLLKCDGNKVQTGYIILSVNTKIYFFPFSEGIFKGDINACNITSATLVAYDVENSKQSEPLQLEINASTETGEISVCF
ncbi:MAG: carboxypeptidase-like regulatory domain-containing protein [Saprospiraceae bacterium]